MFAFALMSSMTQSVYPFLAALINGVLLYYEHTMVVRQCKCAGISRLTRTLSWALTLALALMSSMTQSVCPLSAVNINGVLLYYEHTMVVRQCKCEGIPHLTLTLVLALPLALVLMSSMTQSV